MCDPDTERAKTVAWEAGSQEMGFSALISASDAIVVAAPAEVHHKLGVAALRAGKHVLMEKPMAATLQQAVAVRFAGPITLRDRPEDPGPERPAVGREEFWTDVRDF